MIEHAVDHIRSAASHLFAAGSKLRECARNKNNFNSHTLIDEAEDAEKFASMLQAHRWGLHLLKMADRVK